MSTAEGAAALMQPGCSGHNMSCSAFHGIDTVMFDN